MVCRKNHGKTKLICGYQPQQLKKKNKALLLESVDCDEKAEKAVSKLTANELNTNDGMDILIDIIFGKIR